MKHYFRTALFAIAGVCTSTLHAQSQGDIVEPPLMQYTPTPQTWSFIRYGNTPVDYYTGTVQANIPLYEYSDPDFQFSISAGYASGGFMPQRQTGILGLNWFLNCGGAVTREIRGLDDFASPNSGNQFVNGFLSGGASYSDADLMNFNCGDYSMAAQRYTDNQNPETEVDADIFHFNFMGRSGTFHYDGQRNPKVYNTQGGHGTYKIDKSAADNNNLSKITITTDDGYIYVFGGEKSALERSIPGNFTDFGLFKRNSTNIFDCPVVSWFLTSVTAPNGRTISFTYDGKDDGKQDIDSRVEHPYYVTSFSSGTNRTPSVLGQDRNHYRRANIMRTSYLTGISVSGSVHIDLQYQIKNCRDLNFTAAPPSNEPAYDGNIVQKLKKLDKIEVSYNQQPLRSCEFSYRITDDRLILDSVRVSGIGTYKMTYYAPPKSYPGMLTPDVDFWGYYNGKGNSYGAINPTTITNYTVSMNEKIVEPFKNPDAKYSVAGCLRRIEYPTKGFTEFEYEANRARNIVLKRDFPNAEEDPIGTPTDPIPIEPGHTWPKYLAGLCSYQLYFGSDETGGVRIRRITDHDGLGGCQTRTFEYLYDKSKSSGIVTYFPRFAFMATGNHIIENPLLQCPANTFDKSHIGYGAVREIHADGSSVNYEFTNYASHPDDYIGQQQKAIMTDQPNITDAEFIDNILREPNSRHYQRGKLRVKTLYDAQEKKVLCERTEYADHDSGYSVYIVASGSFLYSVKKPTGDFRVTNKTTVEYFGTDSLWTLTGYGYNDYGQLSYTSRLLSDERCYATEIKYLHETDNSFDPARLPMQYPAEIIESYRRTPRLPYKYITAAKKCSYAEVGNMLKPSVISKVETATPITIVTSPVPPQPTILEYTPKTYYEAYDTKGNPVQLRDAAGTLYSYLWGYGGMYPVAKVMNATYEQIRSALGLTDNAPLSGGLTPTQIDRLYAIENAYVDAYDYKVAVGLTEHTDPARKKYNYEYDSDGRLSKTRDPLGVLQTYEYHF